MSKPKEDKKVDVPREILLELLTPSEIRMLKNRWQIVQLLEEGLSIRSIASDVGVGTDTVVRVARMIEKEGLRKVVNKVNGAKIPFKTNTPWIFGSDRNSK